MSTSPGSIRAGQGVVEVSGTVQVAERSLRSPLTEQACVAYRFEKAVYATAASGGNDRRGDTWQTIHVAEGGVPFYVADGGERVLVDGSTADLDMERSHAVETSDFEAGDERGELAETVVAAVTGGEQADSAAGRDVAAEYAEELRSANDPRRYTEWFIPVDGTVTVRGEAVPPEQTAIGSRLDAGLSGPTEPASSGLFGALKGALGLADEVPVDPRARYKPRAIERLPAADPSEPNEGVADQRAQKVRKAVSMFEGAPQGKLEENPLIIQNMLSKLRNMTDEDLRIAEEAMPDAPALEGEDVVISWGDTSTFSVADAG